MDDDYFDEETVLNWLHNTQTSPGGIGDISNDLGIDNSNLQSVEGPSFSDIEPSDDSKHAASDNQIQPVSQNPETFLSNESYQSASRSAVNSSRSFDTGLKHHGRRDL